jgi:hypothetical protein
LTKLKFQSNANAMKLFFSCVGLLVNVTLDWAGLQGTKILTFLANVFFILAQKFKRENYISLPVYKMSVDKMSVDKMSVDKMRVYKMPQARYINIYSHLSIFIDID